MLDWQLKIVGWDAIWYEVQIFRWLPLTFLISILFILLFFHHLLYKHYQASLCHLLSKCPQSIYFVLLFQEGNECILSRTCQCSSSSETLWFFWRRGAFFACFRPCNPCVCCLIFIMFHYSVNYVEPFSPFFFKLTFCCATC